MKRLLPWILPVFRPILFVLGSLFFVLITRLSFEEAGKWWPVLCTFYNVVTMLFLLLVCKIEGITYRSLIANSESRMKLKSTLVFIIVMFLIGVGGLIMFSFLFYGGLPDFLVQPIPVWVAASNLLLLPITIVFVELPLYFGYSLNKIKEQTQNHKIAIIYTIFFYALQHSFMPLLLDMRFIIFRFLAFLPLMVFLGISYHQRKNMIQMMIGHGIMDLGTGIQLLVMSFLIV